MPPQDHSHFRFHGTHDLTLVTHRRARDLAELLEHLRAVPGSVIYHHTHRFLVQHQYLSPEPPNDFAYWVREVLQEDALGEQLAAVDIMQFHSVRALREGLVARIEQYLERQRSLRVAPEGDEFYFRESVSFVFATPHVAHDLASFADCIRVVGFSALAFHLFHARLHQETGENDFSAWLAGELHEVDLARRIAALDPYTHTLDGLRQRILKLVAGRLEKGDDTHTR